MRERVKQPAIQPALRDRERHDFWPGLVCALIGLILLVSGARHLTGVETTGGETAWETELVKAFSNGGVQQVDTTVRPKRPEIPHPPGAFLPPEPPPPEAPTDGPRWAIKVNLGATGGCPT